MLASSSSRSASRRFVAALCASAIVHALLTSSVKPGSARGQVSGVLPAPVAPRIVARLVRPEVKLTTEPVTPTLEETRVEDTVQKPQKTARVVSRATSTESNAASVGPAEIPDPTYYAARQLDVYPALVSALDITSTGMTSDGGKGYVLLLVLIDATGVVEDVSIVEAQPPGQFDGARHALLSARFRPALRQGRAVKSRVLIHLDYGSEEAGSR
jgi:periplasmic protein TonB